MNVEIRTKAAQFPEKEYINGIFVAVWIRILLLLSKNSKKNLVFYFLWRFLLITFEKWCKSTFKK